MPWQYQAALPGCLEREGIGMLSKSEVESWVEHDLGCTITSVLETLEVSTVDLARRHRLLNLVETGQASLISDEESSEESPYGRLTVRIGPVPVWLYVSEKEAKADGWPDAVYGWHVPADCDLSRAGWGWRGFDPAE